MIVKKLNEEYLEKFINYCRKYKNENEKELSLYINAGFEIDMAVSCYNFNN